MTPTTVVSVKSRVGSGARSTVRGVAGVTLSLVSVFALVTGCAPQPEPVESQGPFATEEEAFAAAEETYRNYVDALNARRADPNASPDPQTFLTGPALEADIRSQQQFNQEGIHVQGATEIVTIVPKSADTDASAATLLVCLDSSATRVIDGDGNDVTPADRAELAALDVGFILTSSRTRIQSSDPTTVDQC